MCRCDDCKKLMKNGPKSFCEVCCDEFCLQCTKLGFGVSEGESLCYRCKQQVEIEDTEMMLNDWIERGG